MNAFYDFFFILRRVQVRLAKINSYFDSVSLVLEALTWIKF